ncbi:hypothetical protein TRIP_C60414 [Candidatus Zixiibacteriota bacterium]|nr:hypothetical protein TRIP_C60414 [candidate division Zixibacteria bacterium]
MLTLIIVANKFKENISVPSE